MESKTGIALSDLEGIKAELLLENGTAALTSNTLALDTIALLLDKSSNDTESLDSGYLYGLAHILKLISRELTENVYGKIVPLDAANLAALVKPEQKQEKIQ